MNSPTTIAQIDAWRTERSEHEQLEFKEGKVTFDRVKLQRYCVALANEGGGKLRLGIEDKSPRRVVGTHAFENPAKVAEQLHSELGFRVDVESVAHPDGRVVVFHVPPRPRGTAYHYEGAYLMRSGESLVPMSEDRLHAIFDEGKPSWLDAPARAGLDAQAVVDLLDTQRVLELLKLPYPATREGVIDRLLAEQLIRREPAGYLIPRYAAVSAAKRLADFPDVASKAPRIVVYAGNSKLDTRLDQVWEAGYAVAFESLLRFTVSQLPQREVIDGPLRRKELLVPEVAVREAVANSLIHQDFTARGARVMIEIYDRRVEISNPGDPVVAVDRFLDSYRSRNEQLADLMRRLHICEEKGSGVDRVVQAAEARHLPAPDFRSGAGRTTTVLFGALPFAETNRPERVRATYQHCVLLWIVGQRMTNSTLRQRFGLTERQSPTVSAVISATVKQGLIRPDEGGGQRKKAGYLPYWA